jgi:uracil-DNA glycosylase family 4
MTADARQLAEHLRFFGELGVEGLSADAAWRARTGDSPREAAGSDPSAAHTAESAVSEPPQADAAAAERSPATPAAAPAPVVSITGSRAEALAVLRDEIGPCTRCKLHAGRTNLVFGTGNPEARLMFVGEGPGGDEDLQGVPFVGRAGQLLTQIIKAMGYEREDVYIANVVKCRPPGNRNPEPDEIERCQPFLMRQIAIIRPAIIVALGKFAAQTLLQTSEPITRLRGHFRQLGDVRVMPTFHPSYLLRNPSAKREVWEDMKQVMGALEEH